MVSHCRRNWKKSFNHVVKGNKFQMKRLNLTWDYFRKNIRTTNMWNCWAARYSQRL